MPLPDSRRELYVNLLTYYLSSHVHNAERHFGNPKCGGIKHLSFVTGQTGAFAALQSRTLDAFLTWNACCARQRGSAAWLITCTWEAHRAAGAGEWKSAACRTNHLRTVYANLAAARAELLPHHAVRAPWLTTWGVGRITATTGRGDVTRTWSATVETFCWRLVIIAGAFFAVCCARKRFPSADFFQSETVGPLLGLLRTAAYQSISVFFSLNIEIFWATAHFVLIEKIPSQHTTNQSLMIYLMMTI